MKTVKAIREQVEAMSEETERVYMSAIIDKRVARWKQDQGK